MGYVKVDFDIIDTFIKNKNLTYAGFSKSLGRDSSFIKNSRSRGTLSQTDYLLIKSLYGIDVKLVEKGPEETKATESEMLVKDMTRAQLYETIRCAVFDAMMTGLSASKNRNLLYEVNE